MQRSRNLLHLGRRGSRQYQEQGSIKDFLQLREKTCELLEQLDKEVSQQSIINKLWRKFELNRLIGQRHV